MKRLTAKKRAQSRKQKKRSWLKFFALVIPLLAIVGALLYAAFGRQTFFWAGSASPSPTNTPLSLEHDPLNSEEFDALKKQLLEEVNKNNPRVALGTLTILMDKYPGVLRSCHAFTHQIGHEAYNKYHDISQALKFQDEVCGSGYLHGVIEQYFKATPDIKQKMRTLCTSYGLSSQAQVCYHAMGHGLMFYSENDLPNSVSACNMFTGKPKVRCLEGVYMENFNTDQKLHPSAYLRAGDPFYPCQNQPGANKAICYFYAPVFYLSLHGDDYAGALKWCLNAPQGYQSSCTNGLATRIMKQHINDPKLVEQICLGAGKEQLKSCIDGMVSYYIVNFASFDQAAQMCKTLTPPNQATCLASVRVRNAQFAQ